MTFTPILTVMALVWIFQTVRSIYQHNFLFALTVELHNVRFGYFGI